MDNNYFEYLYGEKVAMDKSGYNEKKFYLIECKDGEHELKNLISYIGKIGNGGHSFSIIVDPGSKEHERHFSWDGDGPDRINAIVETTTGKDKELVGILLAAMSSIKRLTYAEGESSDDEPRVLRQALASIQEIVDPLLNGTEYEDSMREALREVRFAVDTKDDSAEQKLAHIKSILQDALK